MSKRTGKHRIYMNVGYDLGEQQLRDFFNQYGTVIDVYLPKHKSGRNKGFGFTTFDSEEGLTSALSASEYVIGGDLVKINRAGPRPDQELSREAEEAAFEGAEGSAVSRQPQLFGKGPRLYVGGVHEDLTEERLKTHFSRWGNVVDLYFPGKKGQNRINYCFVTFDNWRAAQRACNQSERSIDGLPLQSINLAQERSAEQEHQAEAAVQEAKARSPAAYSVGAMGAAPNFALLQHLQEQAQMQAQQRGAAGFAEQQQQQQQHQHPVVMPGMMSAPDPSELAAFLASQPEAYQQMLSSMLAKHNMAAGMSNAMLPGAAPTPMAAAKPNVQSPAGFSPFGLPFAPGVSPAEYPQTLDSIPLGINAMSMDFNNLLAAHAQAVAVTAGNTQHMLHLHRMSSQASAGHHDSTAAPLMHHPTLSSVSSGQLAPGNWGWSTGPAPQLPYLGATSGFQSQADFLPAHGQISSGPTAFSGSLPDLQVPVGVLKSTAYGVLRSSVGRGHRSYMPY